MVTRVGEVKVGDARSLVSHLHRAALIRRDQGRVVDSPGNKLLAEFASAVDAVRCAAEVQRAFQWTWRATG